MTVSHGRFAARLHCMLLSCRREHFPLTGQHPRISFSSTGGEKVIGVAVASDKETADDLVEAAAPLNNRMLYDATKG